MSNYVEGDLRAVHEMLVHPLTVPGLSDGGAHCTMIADFDYPTYLLGYWGRDAPAELRIPVEGSSSANAPTPRHSSASTTVACCGRGSVPTEPRRLAALGSTAPTLVDDLPGGGSRLVSRGTGYVATIVRGQVTFEHGVHNGTMAGALARV